MLNLSPKFNSPGDIFVRLQNYKKRIPKMPKNTHIEQHPAPHILVSLLSRHLKNIVKDRPVLLAYFYGSAATGRATPLSDIDIALVVHPNTPLREHLQLMLGISTELEEQSGLFNIDVRIINNAPLIFQGRVITDGILLYKRDDSARIHFETSTRAEYFDYLPVHKKLQKAFFADMKKRGLYG